MNEWFYFYDHTALENSEERDECISDLKEMLEPDPLYPNDEELCDDSKGHILHEIEALEGLTFD